MLALLTLLALQAEAATYDFNADINSNGLASSSFGQWTVGSMPVNNIGPSQFTAYDQTSTPFTNIKSRQLAASAAAPYIRINTSTTGAGNASDYYYKASDKYALMRPSTTQMSVVRFTAPAEGGYTLSMTFRGVRCTTTTCTTVNNGNNETADVYIATNFGGRGAYGFLWSDDFQSSNNGDKTPSIHVYLRAGEKVDFLVRSNDNSNTTDAIALKLVVRDDDDFDNVDDGSENAVEPGVELNIANDDTYSAPMLRAENVSVDWDPVSSGGALAITLDYTSLLDDGLLVTGDEPTGFIFGVAETETIHTGRMLEDGTSKAKFKHSFTGNFGMLDYVEQKSQVRANRTTLFDGDWVCDASGRTRLTYYLELIGGPMDGQKYVWGDFPWYYKGLHFDSTGNELRILTPNGVDPAINSGAGPDTVGPTTLNYYDWIPCP